MPLTREELAGRLRRAREACHMKQEDVARHLGISRSAVAQMEAGNRNVSSLELDKLAYLYGRDIREFFADDFHEQDAFGALFRRHPELADEEAMAVALRKAAALGREITNLERVLGIERDLAALPAYRYAEPGSRWQAIQQGERTADDERRRLGLGAAALPDLAELLEQQGVRTAQLELPAEVSGLTLFDDDLGVFIAVNNDDKVGHSRLRRRFSYAHEHCHALLDRDERGTVSRTADSASLSEVRANAFAAAFLMPPPGVRDFVHRLGKGRPSRIEADIYDGDSAHRIRARPRPGSQSIQMHDVVMLAHHFGVSRLAALYRLKNLGFVSQAEFATLREQEDGGLGADLQRFLDLPEPDADAAQKEFRHRFLALALEAFRREEITQAKLFELAGMVRVVKGELDPVLRRITLARAGGSRRRRGED